MQSDREFKAEWIKKSWKKDLHSAKVLQVKFKQPEKTTYAEQGGLTKSKSLVVLLVNATLDYHCNIIPIRTQYEIYFSFFPISRILMTLHKDALIIQKFKSLFNVSCIKKIMGVLFVEEARNYSYV